MIWGIYSRCAACKVMHELSVVDPDESTKNRLREQAHKTFCCGRPLPPAKVDTWDGDARQE